MTLSAAAAAATTTGECLQDKSKGRYGVFAV